MHYLGGNQDCHNRYKQLRMDNIERNVEKLKSLGLQIPMTLAGGLEYGSSSSRPHKKQDSQLEGRIVLDNFKKQSLFVNYHYQAALGPMERMQLQVAKRRKPRSYRKMHKIWKVNSGEERPNITLNFNQYGQPIGANVPNFLATNAKGKDLPLSCEDWREVDLMAKDKVWERVKDNIAANGEGAGSVSSECGSFVGGKEVALLPTTKPYVCVPKGTLQSTDRKTIVGGCALGSEYHEVLINIVIQKNVELPRPFGKNKYLEDVIGRSIA